MKWNSMHCSKESKLKGSEMINTLPLKKKDVMYCCHFNRYLFVGGDASG